MNMQSLPEPISSATLISGDILAIIVSIVAFSISAIFMLTLIPKRNVIEPSDANWVELESDTLQADEIEADVSSTYTNTYPVPSTFLPIEKNGSQFQIAAKDVISVHANAHYTYVFNGRDDLFCSLSISEVDERLASSLFFRTHRSYIVNLSHVGRIQKSGDAALIELQCAIRRNVPVARARVSPLRKEWSNFKNSIETLIP